MTLFNRIFNSSLGGKYLVAITGLMLTGFVIGHLSGNLLVFAGPEALNAYAAQLKALGPLLWVARIGLLAAFVLHLAMAARLTIQNRLARPERYVFDNTMKATFASRYMIHTGMLTFTFLLFHLAHYTFRLVHSPTLQVEAHDVYGMLVAGFSDPLISGFYVLSIAALAMHLRHGVSSAFQTFGVRHPNISPLVNKAGITVAVIVFFGFSSIPVAVLTGIVK
jgi:succinate dehydrogenase / fumarate reductase cytochrome b subunit